MCTARDLIRAGLRACLGDYKIFFIYEKDLTTSARDSANGRCRIVSEPTSEILQGYSGPQSYGFATVEDGKTLTTCWVWYGEQYKQRNFWPLREGEGKLIALDTVPEARGQGLGPELLAFACAALAERQFKRLYTRTWHSNKPSIRAFRNAGWRRRALVIEVFPFGRKVRLVLGN